MGILDDKKKMLELKQKELAVYSYDIQILELKEKIEKTKEAKEKAEIELQEMKKHIKAE